VKVPSDAELQDIVHKVLQRMESQALAGSPAPMNVEMQTTIEQPQISPRKEAYTVAIGADHGGFEMKEMLEAYLKEKGYQVNDCGTHSAESVDYPDFAVTVAQKVADGSAWRGIVVDGAGIGSCMAANKVKGVRAAMCYDHATASNSREHNNANVLTLGAGLIGNSLAKQIVDTFLSTEFGGGRHARRVDKIMAIEENK
jgi:ribose 5-phosphate isomerase B